MRFLAVAIVAALLAGCAAAIAPHDAPPPAPRSAAADAPELTGDRFVAADGAALPLRRWLPPGSPAAVILALHGFNDYSNAFAGPGAAWARLGIATYAYDQRGFGAAPGRGRWVGGQRLAEDAAGAARLLRQRYPSVPLYLLGESMGGAVAVLAASGKSGAPVPAVDGVILVAPAVWGRETMTLLERVSLWFAGLMPDASFSPDIIPIEIMPSDNIAMLRAFNADPLVIVETRADAINGLVDLMSAALHAGAWFDAPALLLYGEHDEIVPRVPMQRFVRALPPQAELRQRVALYPRGYHMLLRDLDASLPVGDVAAWVADHAAPLPSHADRDARARLTGRSEPLSAAGRSLDAGKTN
jgi:acylglycerol lipase